MKIFAVYKPKGMTSHDVVDLIRKKTGEKRVGHAGTLDPLAEGILVIGVGREATKQLSTIVAKEKEYIATIKLGEKSTTDDEEGEKIFTNKYESGHEYSRIEKIKGIVKKFIGKIQQVPPAYSAIKLSGKKAYQLARKGKIPELKPREVLIKDIKNFELRLAIFTDKSNYRTWRLCPLTRPGYWSGAKNRRISCSPRTHSRW